MPWCNSEDWAPVHQNPQETLRTADHVVIIQHFHWDEDSLASLNDWIQSHLGGNYHHEIQRLNNSADKDPLDVWDFLFTCGPFCCACSYSTNLPGGGDPFFSEESVYVPWCRPFTTPQEEAQIICWPEYDLKADHDYYAQYWMRRKTGEKDKDVLLQCESELVSTFGTVAWCIATMIWWVS